MPRRLRNWGLPPSKGRPLSSSFQAEQRWGGPQYTRWEPVVAADPSSRWVYQMTTEQRPDRLLFRRSNDGGSTWSASRRISPPRSARTVSVRSRSSPSPPTERSTPSASTASHPAQSSRNRATVDGVGASRFASTARCATATSRRSRFHDPARDIYVAFNVRSSALYVAASHDGGATWQAADTSDDPTVLVLLARRYGRARRFGVVCGRRRSEGTVKPAMDTSSW